MTEQHPFFISPKILQQLRSEAPVSGWHRDSWIADRAAQWGWDQREPEIQADVDAELEACCEWLANETPEPYIKALRAARRPKTPSLKEEGFTALELLKQRTTDPNIIEPLSRAVEALSDD